MGWERTSCPLVVGSEERRRAEGALALADGKERAVAPMVAPPVRWPRTYERRALPPIMVRSVGEFVR